MNDEAGFVLHSHPYKETSLIVELFLREHGRVSAVAKGARRPTSALRPVLLQFQPIEFRLSGRRELRTLTRAEWQGGLAIPKGRALWFAFYLNELLMRLLAREDPHPGLFDAYVEALDALGRKGASEPILRRFEWLLLQEIGYAPDLHRDHAGESIRADRQYRLIDGQWHMLGSGSASGTGSAPASVSASMPAGTRARTGSDPGVGEVSAVYHAGAMAMSASSTFSGQVIQHIAAGRYDAPGMGPQAKRLSRLMLGTPLEGASLNTRRILMDLQNLHP